MAEHGIISRPHSQCLSRDEMLAYLSGSLSATERHALEVHLSDCPFCSDALDGVETLDTPATFETVHDDLKLRLDDLTRNGNSPRVRVLFPWRIAAAFALLVASLATLWLAIPDQSNTETISEVFEPYPAPGPAEPRVQNAEPNAEGSPNEKKIPPLQAKEIPLPSETEEDIILSSTNTGSTIDHVQSDKATTDQVIPTHSDLDFSDAARQGTHSDHVEVSTAEGDELREEVLASSEMKKETAKRESAARKPATQAETIKTQKSISGSGGSPQFDEAMRLYNTREYGPALNILRQLPPTTMSGFYAGICSYSLGQYADAERFFQDAIKKGDESLQEAAHWYLALTLAKKGERKKARQYLNKVILFNGEFKLKAEKLLEEL